MGKRRRSRGRLGDGDCDPAGVPTYAGRSLAEVAFPLGGIGTGTISLGGRGNLRDWEIFNSPGKGNDVGPALFALWTKPAGGRAGARVLEAEPLPPFMDRATFMGGDGIPRTQLLGLPRFRHARFRGEYPLARLELSDPAVPLAVSLEAFNPMIPLDEADSGIPAAVFNWTFRNRTGRRVALSLAAVLRNPVGFKRTASAVRQHYGQGNLNEFLRDDSLVGLRMSATKLGAADALFGTVALVTPHAFSRDPQGSASPAADGRGALPSNTDVQTRWHRGGWWDDAHIFWDDFARDGRVAPLTDAAAAPDDSSDVADLVLRATVAPGRSITLTVVLAWHFPNRLRRRHWWSLPDEDPSMLTNWYATRWPDAWAVARHVVAHLPRLSRQTRAYHDALFGSTLPGCVLDAVSSQASIPRTTTCLRLADGSFHGFEGCNDSAGCCPMNCTHVWNYAQSAAFLFPAMERSVRETDFLHNTRKLGKVGAMAFRTILPVVQGLAVGTDGNCKLQIEKCRLQNGNGGAPNTADGLAAIPEGCGPQYCVPSPVRSSSQPCVPLPAPTKDYDAANDVWDFKPAADGQMGTIMRACREWRQSGDRAWLARIWPDVVRALEFAWLGEDGLGRNAWDPARAGVIIGGQHNTYDIEFFGPNPLTSVMYLGALRAGEELARAMGEPDRAVEYRRIYESGRTWVDRNLWSKDYYVQRIELPPGRDVPDKLRAPDGSPKYQVGGGCLSDQLLGQFLAHVAGLGHLLDARKVRRAVGSIFRYNFRRRLGDHPNVQRVYGAGDESGLLLCTWPRGGKSGGHGGREGSRETLPFPYCDEVWTGVEYHVAAALVYEGLIDEALAVVAAARRRYAGHNRNPFNEVECGHHYARAMSSWGLLLALSGFSYDAASAAMGFAPKIRPADFRTFYSTGSSWGVFSQTIREQASGIRHQKKQTRRGRAGASLTARLRVDYGEQPLRTLTLAPFSREPQASASRSPDASASNLLNAGQLHVAMSGDGNTVGVPATVASGSTPGELVITFAPPVTIRAGQTLTLRIS